MVNHQSGAWVGLFHSMRPVQWVKNGFTFAPLIFAGLLFEIAPLLRVTGVFFLFCASSSAVYIFNDLLDRRADRVHSTKRNRPIASGALRVSTAWCWAALLAVISLFGAAFLSSAALFFVTLYLLNNALYSWRLKQYAILDIFSVAAGFVLRVLAGAAMAQVPVSSWLLICSSMLALFLAISKRRYELIWEPSAARPVLGKYRIGQLDQMMGVVTGTTLFSYLMYAVAPETEARLGQSMLFTVPFVLYGIFRYQFLIYLDDTAENPTDTLLADRPLLITVLLWLATAAIVVVQGQ